MLACRSFAGWQRSLLIVKPDTILRFAPPGARVSAVTFNAEKQARPPLSLVEEALNLADQGVRGRLTRGFVRRLQSPQS
jgi:hypothetical protein